MRQITVQDLEAQVLNAKVNFWSPRRCSICNDRVGYIFGTDALGKSVMVAFDPKCNCFSRRIHYPVLCSIDEILEHYKKMNDSDKDEFLTYWELSNENV